MTDDAHNIMCLTFVVKVQLYTITKYSYKTTYYNYSASYGYQNKNYKFVNNNNQPLAIKTCIIINGVCAYNLHIWWVL